MNVGILSMSERSPLSGSVRNFLLIVGSLLGQHEEVSEDPSLRDKNQGNIFL